MKSFSYEKEPETEDEIKPRVKIVGTFYEVSHGICGGQVRRDKKRVF